MSNATPLWKIVLVVTALNVVALGSVIALATWLMLKWIS